ncbi:MULTISPECIES: phosphatase PAP2 family protein [unclassified Arsukibacterium]|uniref:phosphatase PAP2 family protein n=1 Tax=Chromatiaceae TaxID=1046 RepID=UPI001DEF2F0E|nr:MULTISPECIES: phosphatase PAP2 family protein [unclassified Arsukibacterium]MBU1308730.1 phosphatase PAP2 family protein [Gammaproteobacteria bacterium]MBU1556668.1 phosphatase PAP2 family protein [Gammaproteobacteria bacterium]MBU2072585.1 phosphatase PAP2 family protein [Gammaproteobacteria bacterium]MBU2184115.1 phosphatase PAP2 family protein [Gammaproteobacteria bacterium]MBU2206799.1 phosphatase PAP2 family protein [Gammaproteobacteria bacterium]|tara:strand:- start:93417 stop:94121 length:705 start_codon:yes stop_codon:yes gene_type:complete
MVIRQFLLNKTSHVLFAGFVVLILLFDVAGLDVWLATKLYALEGNQWALREHWLTEDILHKGARKLNYILASAVLLTTVYYHWLDKTNPKLSNAYLALTISLISSFALVAYFKAITNIACPWSLSLFGGIEPYIHLLQTRPSNLPYSQCFPAGHASVGYAWVALYYFFKHSRYQYRFFGLAASLVCGFLLGITQQLRGAHFMSHDITTLFICICCAKLSFSVFFPPAIITAREC